LRRDLPHACGADTPQSPEERYHRERSLAIARVFLALSILIAGFFQPSDPGSLFLRHLLFAGYLVFSVAVLLLLRYTPERSTPTTVVVHAVDLLLAAGVTVLTGPGSPFVVLVMFVLLAAAHRWGFRETIATGAAVAILLLTHAVVISVMRASAGSTGPSEFGVLTLRAALVLLAAVLLGYMAQTEKRFRAEAATIGAIVGRVELRSGLTQTITQVLDATVRLFAAKRAVLVVHEITTGRIASWEAGPRTDPSGPSLRVTPLDERSVGTYLFAPSAAAWHAIRRGARLDVVALDREGSRTDQAPLTFPESFSAAMAPFDELMAIGVEVPDELTGRLFLIDPHWDGDRRSGLAFAQRLVRHLSPAVYSLYLVHRLRSRSAAAERGRIARELHDGIIQSVLGVQIQLHALSVPAAKTSRALSSELNRLGTILRDEVVGLRDMIQQMKPVELSPDQLMNTLADVVQRFQRETGITARFITAFDRLDLSPRACREVARVVQEALVNVRKHSGAGNVFVRLTVADGVCRLAIDDDGRGFPFAGRLTPADKDHARQGPSVINERVRLLGGELTVESDPGRGARLEISFPVATHAIHG
jgi:signal transduction histidine kinase